MKKLLTVLVSVLMTLACSTMVFAEDNTTEVNYTVSESYEFTVPATTTIASDATVLTNGVAITKNSIAVGKKLQISVASTNSWNLKLVDGTDNDKLAYTASLDSSTWAAIANNAVVLEKAAGTIGSQNLYAKLTSAAGNETKAGTYKDTLTFTAAVVDAN